MPKANVKRKVGVPRNKLLLTDSEKESQSEKPSEKKKTLGKIVGICTPDRKTERKVPGAPKKKRKQKQVGLYRHVSTQESYELLLEQSRRLREKKRRNAKRRLTISEEEKEEQQEECHEVTVVQCEQCEKLINKADAADHDKICEVKRGISMVTVSHYNCGSDTSLEGKQGGEAIDYMHHVRDLYTHRNPAMLGQLGTIFATYAAHLPQLLRATVEKYGTLPTTPHCVTLDNQLRFCSFAVEKDLTPEYMEYVTQEYPKPEHAFLELERRHGHHCVPFSVFDPKQRGTLMGKIRLVLAEKCPEQIHMAQEVVDEYRGCPEQFLRWLHEDLDPSDAVSPTQHLDRRQRLMALLTATDPSSLPHVDDMLDRNAEHFEAFLYELHVELQQ